MIGANLFEGVTFLEVFINLLLVDLVAFGTLGLIVATMIWFINGIRKGLKEEKKRYESKHCKNDR